MKDVEQLANHKVRAGPENITVVGHLNFEVIAVDDQAIFVQEVGGEGLTAPLDIAIFKDETNEVPDQSWIGRTVYLVRRRVEKEWVSWELS